MDALSTGNTNEDRRPSCRRSRIPARTMAGATGLEPAVCCVISRRSTLSEAALLVCWRELAG